jgi:hypothetical protein
LQRTSPLFNETSLDSRIEGDEFDFANRRHLDDDFGVNTTTISNSSKTNFSFNLVNSTNLTTQGNQQQQRHPSKFSNATENTGKEQYRANETNSMPTRSQSTKQHVDSSSSGSEENRSNTDKLKWSLADAMIGVETNQVEESIDQTEHGVGSRNAEASEK